MIKEGCHVIDGLQCLKTKTSKIIPSLQNPSCRRKPLDEIVAMNKKDAKDLIISHYGMLECGTNFKGTLPDNCTQCNETDNESHRLNTWTKWQQKNQHSQIDKLDFDNIHSSELVTLKDLLTKINKVWNITNRKRGIRLK